MHEHISPSQSCEHLCALLAFAKHALIKMAEEYDLTPPQVAALRAIFEGRTSMSDVAATLVCDASNVTGIIDRLVQQKLVVRKESEYDRRAKTLALTSKGKRTITRIIRNMPKTLGCTELSEEERLFLRDITAKLRTL